MHRRPYIRIHAYHSQSIPSSSVTTNDGNGLSSTTNYDYSGGYYHTGERDFRGFNRVTVTGPEDPNHVRVITETWFHRGNDTRTVTDIFTPQSYADDPTGKDGYMKGRPYFTRVTDSQGRLHSVSTTAYYPADRETPPYFTPDRETNSYSCDDGICKKHIRTVNTYDNTYGNLLRTDDYGDVDDPNDDRTIVRTYAVNASAWIVGLPSIEMVYKGIGNADTDKISNTTYYYDGVPPVEANCGSASFTGNEIPDRGLVTHVVRWLDPKVPGETDPEERMAYDSYGNLACSWDAKGNPPAFFSYDGTHTYRRFARNPLRHESETRYYGVDNESVDNGLYAQIKNTIDPNGTSVESYYDPLGRKIATFFWPEGTWGSWTYPAITSSTGNTYGVVGAQHVQTDNVTGNKTWAYTDGLGRTILEKQSGPNGSIVEVRTVYNANGSVKERTMPAFTGASNVLKTTFTYDAQGRTTDVTNPDGTTTHACYRGNITVSIDADKHRKRATRRGLLVKMEEYLGTYDLCSTEEGTPYTTTTYEYDLKGQLVKVTDTSSNETRMEYDSLGRKMAMHDPDSGDWTYEYDKNGNLTKQTDGNHNTISLTYDEVNRIVLKDYPTGTDVQFRYDDPTSTYSIGRLTAMTDASGTTTFNYDYMGRPVTMTKHIDGSSYTITNGYENALLVLETLSFKERDRVRMDFLPRM